MFNNLNSTLKKVVVIFLIITLTYANLVLIGTNIVQGLFSYASEEQDEQNLVVANQELVMNKVYGEDEEQRIVIQVAVETGIESEEYPIKASTITLRTDLIEGTLVDAKVTELNKNSYTSGTWEVSEEGKLIISLVNENETLETKEKGLDKFLVTYVFENSEVETIIEPLEKVEVTTYGEEVLTKECETANFENINVEKELSLLNIENKDIHKTTIESGKVDFTESLNLNLSYRNQVTNITIEDVSNDFYNVDGQENEEVVLKYNKTVLNRDDLSALIGETGKLVITDNETSKELIALTKEKLTIEESEKQYYTIEETEEQELRSELSVVADEVIIEYSIDVASLKIELIEIVPQSNTNIDISDFVIENTKSILNVNDVENLSYLQQNVKYIVDEEKTAQSTINFKDTVTRASLTVDNTEWVVGETNSVNYTITLDTTTEKSELFVNPMFLIELPSSVESINTANSEFTVNNDGGVFTNKKVFTTTVLGKKYVVVTLIGEQTEESVQNGNTTVNLKLELNVSADETEGNETTKIYYQNDTVTTYENGASFDTDEVEVSLILNNEEKEEIGETTTPEEGNTEGSDEGETETIISNVEVYIETIGEEIKSVGEEITYIIKIYNYDEFEKENLVIEDILPKGITLQKVVEMKELDEINADYNYNEETRLLTIDIDKVESAIEKSVKIEGTGETHSFIQEGKRTFKIIVKANELEEGLDSREVKNFVKLRYAEEILAESEEITHIISKPILVVEKEEIRETINEKEEIVIGLKITNKGFVDASGVNIKIEKPEGISFKKYKTSMLSENGDVESLGEGILNSDFEEEGSYIPAKKTYYIQLIGMVSNIEETKNVTIEGSINQEDVFWNTEIVNIPDGTNPDGTNPDGTNPDGTNPDGTNPDGTNPDGTNPDGINPDETNPDGTKPNQKVEGFDLSLTQYLNKVTVENAEGTTVYEYTDTNFAKVEIHSKYMNGSKITFEYKMIIENKGTIPGYARKIVNYKPEGLEFNQDLNKDWYIGDDGNLYSVTLIEKLLNPGEEAELTILLTKQMTNEDGGTIKNTVEIYEASNNENVEDVNSIPGDKLDGQNDMSTVEVIVAVKTGTIILYITLATVVIVIIGLGFYKIKKVALNKKGGC